MADERTRRVRLTQLDGILPNLALMAIAHWHRARGDEIVFSRSPYRQLGEPEYDRAYASAIFNFSQERVRRYEREFPGAVVGGTGTTVPITVVAALGEEPQGIDYSFYPEFDASIGFTQRGCRLSCKFCVVPKKEGKPVSVNSIADIWRGGTFPKHLHLLDNDFFGQAESEWKARIAEIRAGGFKVAFTQGINVRAVTDDVAIAIASIEYRDDAFERRRLYTAWDNLKDEEVFFRGIDTLERHGVPARNVMAYMLIGFDKKETWDRIHHRFNRMVARGIRPFPMVFDNARRDLKRFQRWAVTGRHRFMTFAEYSTRRRPHDRSAASGDLFEAERANG